MKSSASSTEKPIVDEVVKTDAKTETAAKTYKEGDIFIGKTPPPIPVPQDQLVSPYGFGPYPELPQVSVLLPGHAGVLILS